MESHSAPPHPGNELLEALLTVTQTGVIFFEPVYSQDGTRIIDLACVRLNPAAQQKLQLPERPTQPFLTLYPHALETGIFAFYRDTFLSGKAGRYDVNYAHEGLDCHFHLSATPAGNLLVVSFDDTAHQPRTAAEVALRESEAREKAALARLQALNEELTAAKEELRTGYEERQASNGELFLARTALEELNGELERVAKRTLQLQQARQETGRQIDRLERFFRQVPACICVLGGEELVFELVNPAFQQLYPGRELLGKSVREALPEIARGPFYEILRQVYQTGRTFEGREVLFPMARYQGGPVDELYFNFIYQARLDEQGKADGILAFGYEVTKQALARQKADESEEHFRTFADNIQNLAWMAEPDGWIYWYNQQWYDYTGTTLEEMQGWGWEKVHHPDHLERVVAFVREAWQKGETWELTFPLKGADGEYRWFITRAYAVKDDQGQVFRWIGTNTDIDAQKRAQEALLEREKEAKALAQELAAANEELQAASEEVHSANEELAMSNATLTGTIADLNRVNQDLDNFVYTASHDLKAPILNIEGLLRALERQLGRERMQQESVQQIYGLLYNSVNRFKRTIGDLTEVARISKESTEDVSSILLAEVLQEVLEDMEPQIREAGVRVEQPPDCPEVYFSRKNLKSVLYNLLSNAVRYRSPERDLHVRITCLTQGDYHVLTVQDNGLGMDMRQKDKIFALFKRLHNHVEGTGIGLYIVKKMVENAGGKIEVESQVGVGSAFKVFFKR